MFRFICWLVILHSKLCFCRLFKTLGVNGKKGRHHGLATIKEENGRLKEVWTAISRKMGWRDYSRASESLLVDSTDILFIDGGRIPESFGFCLGQSPSTGKARSQNRSSGIVGMEEHVNLQPTRSVLTNRCTKDFRIRIVE